MGDRGAAAQLAACLMRLVVLALLALERWRAPRPALPPDHQPPPAAAAGSRCAAGGRWRLSPVCPAGAARLRGAGRRAARARLLQVGDPLEPRASCPSPRNSVMLAALAARSPRCAGAAAGLGGAAAPAAGRSGWRCGVAGLGYAMPGSVIAVGTLVPLGRFDNALDALDARRTSASRPGCCCRARSRRWSSPISCASWRSRCRPVEAGLGG